jgi:hypothetical protein
MERILFLPQEEWRTLLEFANTRAAEIAEFDDQDEIYVAVTAVVAKIEAQLKV